MSKSINVEITTQEQRDQLIKQLQGMSFDREVKSWEEYLETIDSDISRRIQNTLNYMTSVERQYRALYKLDKLKNYYNDGWTPDWAGNYHKFVIVYLKGKAKKSASTWTNFFLAFETEKIRDKFLENHSDLIEQAKPLL